ncbi:MAG: hypothetical protein BM557_11580 [Flavobacterium sp. MedPE-SWcel]|uniref:hypothetical protein n=1 Tax=uncultured Flavobacterium sp. TaxID=165435 RepID=UPI00091D939E|nr:hypothetical protein [uncultured Flavobacterium sp.]OIQ15349.1 MAG: hypothetical protein BM557_11580 [Flavobacterium sp. MedPE-SWcel]
MRNKLLLVGLSLFVLSCSSDDSTEPIESTSDFLPLTDANYWDYNVESSVAEGNGSDHLYISGDVVIDSNTYKKFETENTAYGFFSNILGDNAIRKADDKILLTGSTSVDFFEDIPFSVDVADFIIFKENTTNNQVLGTLTGVFEQEYEGYPIEFNYTLTSTAKESLTAYTVDGDEYTNVKSMELKLSITAVVNVDLGGISVPVTIMPQQDVVTSTQYYAENIGVVHVSTDLGYELSDLSAYPITIPIPESADIHQEEILTTYVAE